MNYSYPAPWKATLQKSQPTLLHAFHAMPSWGHGGTYNRFAISPQNNILLTGGDDYIIKWWSASGQLMRTSYGHTSQIVAFDFHPTGTMVASGEFEGTIHIWDVPSGRCILTIKVHEPVTQITWSPNGKWLMVLTDSLIDEHIVVLIYAESSPQPIAIYQLKDPVHNIDNFGASWWSEDQVLMLQEAGASFSANLWEVHSNTFQPLPEIFDGAIKCLTRPGGSSRDDSTPKDHLVLFLPHAYSLNIALSPNHQYLMLEKNHCVTFWNLKTLTQQGILRGSWSSIPHHAWSPDSQEFCLAGDDGLLYFYTMSSGQTNTWNIDLKGGVWNISWFPHKDRLIMHLFDCTEILDIRTRTVLYQLPYNKGFPEAFAWGGPAGDLMAMGTSDGKIRLWKYASGEVIREWTPFKHDCELLRWDPKGNILLAYERYQYEH